MAERIGTAQQEIKDLEGLIHDVDNCEDWASLEAGLDERRQWLDILKLVEECQDITSRPSRYSCKIGALSVTLPGAKDLYDFTRSYEYGVNRMEAHLLRIYEVGDLSWSKTLSHQFALNDPTQIARHLELMTSVSSSSWPLILADHVSPYHVISLGHLLNLDPRLFISHMWRSFYQHPLAFGLPMMETPSARVVACELHDRVTGKSHPVYHSQSLGPISQQHSAAANELPIPEVVQHAAVEGIRQRH